jgi:hypothetical protein
MTHTTGHSRLRSALIAAVGFAALAYSATELRANVIFPSLPAGSQYEMLFVTLDTTTATSSDIDTYNTFVTNEANLNPALAALGVQWHAVASTATVAAFNNAPDNGIAVYNTNGLEVATPSLGIYSAGILANSNTLLDSPYTNQFGNDETFYVPLSLTGLEAWTGATPQGGMATSFQPFGAEFASTLGSTDVTLGQPFSIYGTWLDYTFETASNSLPIYALSSPITVVPESATIALLGSSFLTIGGMQLVRRRVLA